MPRRWRFLIFPRIYFVTLLYLWYNRALQHGSLCRFRHRRPTVLLTLLRAHPLAIFRSLHTPSCDKHLSHSRSLLFFCTRPRCHSGVVPLRNYYACCIYYERTSGPLGARTQYYSVSVPSSTVHKFPAQCFMYLRSIWPRCWFELLVV